MSSYMEVPAQYAEGKASNELKQIYKIIPNSDGPRLQNFKVYNTRWFMLYLQIICAACMAMQLLEYSINANIIVNFYGISYEAVNWSTMLLLLGYIPTIFPIMHITNKIEMRSSVLISIAGSCLGAWIKVGSVAPDRYWVIIIGQIVVCLTQGFIMVLPARFAVAWFGKNQVALACGLGVLGTQVGTAIGCILPSIVVKPSNIQEDIARSLYVLNIGFALICTVSLLLIFLFFRSKPPTPPSGAQKQLEDICKLELIESTKQLFSNFSFVLTFIASGISMGISYTITTLLSQVIWEYYPASIEDAGRIGLLILAVGMLGVTVCGYILDKFQNYRYVTVLIMSFYLLSMIAFTLAIHHSIFSIYLASAILGFFMTGIFPLYMEVAAEMTYPISETTSSGYLLASGQAFGIGFIYLYAFILYRFGAFWANIITCIEIFICMVLVLFIKFDYKRRAAEKLERAKEEKMVCIQSLV